jgi:hypothetical protein
MKRMAFRLVIAVFTFTIGVAGAWLISTKANVRKALPEVLSEISAMKPESERPRFRRTLRACGTGYSQGYELPDGRELSEGSSCHESSDEARMQWQKLISGASKIIERVPQYKNKRGENGERVVALFPPDENGRQWARVMWYDGGECYLSINAPTLEIAIEFEKSDIYAR